MSDISGLIWGWGRGSCKKALKVCSFFPGKHRANKLVLICFAKIDFNCRFCHT